MKTALLAAVLAATATAAHAACPTGADMATGTLKIVDQHGGIGLYTLKGDGKVYEAYDPDKEEGFWVETLYGIYVLRDGNLKFGEIHGDIRVLTYPTPLDQMPNPDQPGSYMMEASVKNTPDAPPEAEKIQVTIGPMGKFGVGACSYDSRLITLLTDFADGSNSLAQIAYLPELQIGFYHGYGTREDMLTEYYRPMSIEMVPN